MQLDVIYSFLLSDDVLHVAVKMKVWCSNIVCFVLSVVARRTKAESRHPGSGCSALQSRTPCWLQTWVIAFCLLPVHWSPITSKTKKKLHIIRQVLKSPKIYCQMTNFTTSRPAPEPGVGLLHNNIPSPSFANGGWPWKPSRDRQH